LARSPCRHRLQRSARHTAGRINGLTSGSSIALSGTGAAGLSIAGEVITGTPTTVGAVNIIETLEGATRSPRMLSGVVTIAAAAVVLNPLTLSPSTATIGTAYTGTVSGKELGTTLALSGTGAAGFSVSGATVSGTPTTAGAVNFIEPLAGTTGSPRTSSGVLAVSAAAAWRQVGRNTFVPNKLTASNTTQNLRSPKFAVDVLPRFRIVIPNWYALNSASATAVELGIVTATIEYRSIIR